MDRPDGTIETELNRDALKELESYCNSIFAGMDRERRYIMPIWKSISDYVMPRFSGWDFKEDQDLTAGEKIYDGEAIAAHARQSSGIFGWLVSPTIPWLEFLPRDRKLRNNKKFMEYLRDIQEYLYEVLARSNFYDAIAQDIDTGTGIGTSVITVENSDEMGCPVYETLHPREIYLSENKYHFCDILARRYQITHRQLIERYGNIYSEEEKKSIMKDPDTLVFIKQFVFPNRDYIPGNDLKLGANKKYKSVHVSEDAPKPRANKTRILKVSGMDDQRWLAWRYQKISGLVYGSCAAMDGIYDIKTINLQGKTLLDVQQLAARPPLQTSELMKGKLRISPGGVTYGYDEVKPVFTGANQYPILPDAIERRSKIIREHFKTDFFQSISQLQATSRERTATEISELKAEAAAVMGSILGRIQSERLDPLIRLTILIEKEAGRLPEPPNGIPENAVFDLNFIGPLTQSQRKFLRIQGIRQGMLAAMELSQDNPDLLLNFDRNYAVREVAVAHGYPLVGLFDENEAKKSQEEVAKARAQMQQAKMENERLAAMGRGSREASPGSPTDELMREKRG